MFCLIMDEIFDISSECQQQNMLDMWTETIRSTIFVNDPRFSWLKYQILKYFEDCLTTIELRQGVYEKSAIQIMFIKSQIYKGYKNHCTYCHRTGI